MPGTFGGDDWLSRGGSHTGEGPTFLPPLDGSWININVPSSPDCPWEEWHPKF